MEKTEEKTKEKIIQLLSEQLGVEPEDISEEDSLSDDLHMGPASLADFAKSLEAEHPEVSGIDLTEVETVGDLIQEIHLEKDLE